MSGKQLSSNELSPDEQAFDQPEDREVDEDGFEVVDDRPEFRPTVQQETQAKVDSNHPDGIVQDFSHLPLAQEERIRAREAELEHISAQAELGTQDGRAERTRAVVEHGRRRARERTRTDPREHLSRMELARVNQEAERIVQRLRTDHSRAAVARVLGRRVAGGQELTEAVFATIEELRATPGALCPIGDVPDVPTSEVSVEGTVIELWRPSHSAIAQVGLIADETAKIKWTSWRKSRPAYVREGKWVRLRGVKKNWYRGRCSLAVTSDSMIVFPDRDDRWWEV